MPNRNDSKVADRLGDPQRMQKFTDEWNLKALDCLCANSNIGMNVFGTAKRPAGQNWRINNSKINIVSVVLICCGATCILIRLKNF